MGLFVLFFGTKKKFNKIKHHTIIFGKEYFELLEKIFKKHMNFLKIYQFTFIDLQQQIIVLLQKGVIVFTR